MLSSRLIRLIPFWQPQQHPARDAHDTFFISDPATTPTSNFPPDYLERVKAVHSKGGFGSQGYQYDWKEEEAQKNLLRTHTTAVSARMLYKLAQVVGGNVLLVYKYSHSSRSTFIWTIVKATAIAGLIVGIDIIIDIVLISINCIIIACKLQYWYCHR